MNLYPKNKIPDKKVRKFIETFYIIGSLGFIIPFTKELFIFITPFALLLNTYLLGIYHTEYNLKTIGVFMFVFVAGFFIEVIGVNTGIIFGNYKYGSGLGIKLFDTPLLIGVNWLFLSYTSISVLNNIRLPKMFSFLIPPSIMLAYDLVLEQVAPKMDMWSWQNNSVPIQNYVAWFFIAFVFTLLIKLFKIDINNALAKILLICQLFFFVLLMFILK